MFSVLGNQSLSLPLSAIKTLTGTNYEDWYVSLTINLAIMNLDLTLRLELRHLLNLLRKVFFFFFAVVGDKFTKFDKARKGTFMKLLTTTTYDSVSGVREHIMKLTHFINKLRQIKVELADCFLVWQVLKSLPSQFDALKTTYNA
jgi:hypothetical protein